MSDKLVSIIILTFNRKDFIKKAIDSVFKQTYKNIELVIVDDGSTDNTIDYLKKLVKDGNYDKSRIKIYSHFINRGIPATLNFGFSRSSGEYICQLSSDDFYIDEDKIKKQVEILDRKENQDVGLIYTDYMFKDLDEDKQWNVNC